MYALVHSSLHPCNKGSRPVVQYTHSSSILRMEREGILHEWVDLCHWTMLAKSQDTESLMSAWFILFQSTGEGTYFYRNKNETSAFSPQLAKLCPPMHYFNNGNTRKLWRVPSVFRRNWHQITYVTLVWMHVPLSGLLYKHILRIWQVRI